MDDVGRVMVPTGDATWDETNGAWSQAYEEEPIYEGQLSVLMARAQGGQPQLIGDEVVPPRIYVIKMPYFVVGLRKGLHVVVDESRDPELVGRTLVMQDVERSTWATCRRVVARE